ELDALAAYGNAHSAPLRIGALREPRSARRHSPTVTAELPDPAVLHRLRSLGVSLVIPLHLSQRLAGLILLGSKRAGGDYTGEDADLLEGIRLQMINALQKARRFESDRTKSEFVSIAAHELLTPIAAVQGYLSLVLDDHPDLVNEQASGYLGK